MSTFFVSASPSGQPFSLPLIASHQLLQASRYAGRTALDDACDAKPHPFKVAEVCTTPPDPWTGEDAMTRTSVGRCRSPVAQPLRKRQLPASFWQEPNVPRAHPSCLASRPFLHPADWPVPARAGQGGGEGGDHCGSGHKHGQPVHKEFLDRLQKAQVRGYDLAASRFPITEFLFYNYGLRSYLHSAGSSPAGPEPSPGLGSALSLLLPPSASHPAPMVHRSSSRGAVETGRPVVSAGYGASWSTLPTLCPYLGYNCPNLHTGRPHRIWDCVRGQAAAMGAQGGEGERGGQRNGLQGQLVSNDGFGGDGRGRTIGPSEVSDLRLPYAER